MFQPISNSLDPSLYLRQARPGLHKGQNVEAKTTDPGQEQPTTAVTSQKLLNKQIMAALNQALAKDGAPPIQSLKADDFTPDKVADRVLKFVKNAIDLQKVNGGDTEQLESLYAQAREGVEKGFGEAKDILEGMRLFEGDIKDNANQTYDLIMKGLDALQQGKDPAETGATQQLAAYQSASYSETRDLSLEIRTQDGDTVRVRISQEDSASSSQGYAASDAGTLFVSQEQASSRFNLRFEVQGELDQDEQTALKNLLQDVDKLADKFYSNGGPESLQQALKLGYDSSELAGFSLELNQTQSFQAVQAYRQVNRLGDQGSQSSRPDASLVQPFGALVQDLRDLLQQNQVDKLLADPKQSLGGLIGQRIGADSRYPQTLGTLGNAGQDLLSGLLDRVLGGVMQSGATSNSE